MKPHITQKMIFSENNIYCRKYRNFQHGAAFHGGYNKHLFTSNLLKMKVGKASLSVPTFHLSSGPKNFIEGGSQVKAVTP
jgi:hypothetical protein